MTMKGETGRIGLASGAMSIFRAFNALRRDNSGVAALEFGVIAPAMLLLIFMIVETAVYYYKQSHLQFVLHDAGRKIQTGEIQASNTPQADFLADVCSAAKIFFDCSGVHMDVRSFPTLADVVFPKATFDTAGEPTNFTFEPGGSSEITAMRASATHAFITPFLTNILQPDGDPVIMVGFTIFKNEPF
ncbi:TadE/TadG family type IV pilus assembly protein [Oricola sp.]|uniref:TadE/TadG family type IV pilus assembly protein n=1 Tax=Oricola sp. TaxID=1979950 RepID=UPI003BADBDF2